MNDKIKFQLESDILKSVQKLSDSEQAGQHLKSAATYASKGISQWAHANPKIATALAAGAAGLAMGKRLSRKN